ncbi:hypothetical protein V1525DRAFT_102792 [Lipomyces kononenkoae]|uniref:Uncharacterized protein n=1 Tax=Lipomyces kononenkoae TaxID=34357 RepID=A0ACC3SQT1_LIPKO
MIEQCSAAHSFNECKTFSRSFISGRKSCQLQLEPGQQDKGIEHSVQLQLSFNQLLILATRPVLLLVLRRHVAASRTPGAEAQIPDSSQAIADACIRCARQSSPLLTESWINGAFHVVDYFYTQHLFSATTRLANNSTGLTD